MSAQAYTNCPSAHPSQGQLSQVKQLAQPYPKTRQSTWVCVESRSWDLPQSFPWCLLCLSPWGCSAQLPNLPLCMAQKEQGELCPTPLFSLFLLFSEGHGDHGQSEQQIFLRQTEAEISPDTQRSQSPACSHCDIAQLSPPSDKLWPDLSNSNVKEKML